MGTGTVSGERVAAGLETEADAYKFLERLRWGSDGPTQCPHCSSTKGAWFLTPRDPEGRRSRGGSTARSHRRVWKCRESSCRRQFSVLTNTSMHATKMPVRAWVGVVFDLCSRAEGVSIRDISERWGVAEKSAASMLRRIEESLREADQGGLTWVEIAGSEVSVSMADSAPADVWTNRLPDETLGPGWLGNADTDANDQRRPIDPSALGPAWMNEDSSRTIDEQ